MGRKSELRNEFPEVVALLEYASVRFPLFGLAPEITSSSAYRELRARKELEMQAAPSPYDERIYGLLRK